MAIWAGFWLLGLVWGASFLLIKIGVTAFTPMQLVALRVGIAAIAMLLTLYVRGQRFPSDWRSRWGLIFVGIINTALPFFLITWGEQSIDSGLATVLNATTPLFSLLIAHFALAEERITLFKVLGLAMGFLGILVLTSGSFSPESNNSMAGQVAVLVASSSYAGAAVYMRRYLKHLKPIVISSGALLTASLIMVPASLIIDGPPSFAAIANNVLLSVLVLGLVNTYIAYLLYYWIIDVWGATRATLVTYVMPPVGLALGAIFLDEVADITLIIGAVMIIAGVFIVNRKRQPAIVKPAELAAD